MNRDHKKCLKNPNWIRQQENHVKNMIAKKEERIISYNNNPKLCKYCNKPIDYKKKS